MKTIQSIKNQKNKSKKNKLTITCAISGQAVASENAICINTHKNNTTYISSNYLKLFNDNTSKTLQLDLLTMITYNDCKININNVVVSKTITTDIPVLAINFKNNIQLYLFQHYNEKTNKVSNSNLCGFMNLLKLHKKEIKSIYLVDTIAKNFTDITIQSLSENIVPTYTLIDYYYKNYRKYYNPAVKKDIIKYW